MIFSENRVPLFRIMLLRQRNVHSTVVSFASPQPLTKDSADGLAVADFNGDGKPDLITADFSSSTLSVLLGNGDGTFHPGPQIPLGTQPTALLLGQFNPLDDHFLDLAVVSPNSDQVAIFLGNGDGTFQLVQTLAAQRLAVGQFHGTADNVPDLAVASSQADAVRILLNDGHALFQDAGSIPVGTGDKRLVRADLNGDGQDDLVAVNTTSSVASLLRGNGDGTFTPMGSLPVPGHVDFVAAGEIGRAHV